MMIIYLLWKVGGFVVCFCIGKEKAGQDKTRKKLRNLEEGKGYIKEIM
jgi:hypothetical protein